MNKLVLFFVACFILILPTKIKAQVIDNTNIEGQVYINNFDDLTGLILNETNGTVTASPIIGTITPEVTNALTIDHVEGGSVTAAIDLGQAYDRLYIQWYSSVIKDAGATNYTNHLEVGSAIEANEAAQILFRHDVSTLRWKPYGTSQGGYQDMNRWTNSGTWYKYGMILDRVNLTVEFFVNGVSYGQIAAKNRDLRYITLGGTGNNKVGYKVQYTALSVNTNHFQDIVTNSNGIGTYVTQFVDYSSIENTNYNGVDLSALDKSHWTGRHSEPFDPDGATNYIDGPTPYTYNLIDNNNLFGKGDKILYKKGVTHKIENLSRGHKTALNGAYIPTLFNTIDAYGEGSMPIIDSSMKANPFDWEIYDALNGIYRMSLNNVNYATGAWQEGGNKAMRKTFLLANMKNQSGCWFEDGTYFYIRLWDDTNPALQNISIGTNQVPSFGDYTEIRNLHWRHANILVNNEMLVEHCEFSKSSGATVTNAIFRDNKLYDNWSGVDYGATEASNPGLGLGGSGLGGAIGLKERALVYRNTIEDSYLAVSIFSDAHDAVFAFNEIKNTIVNTISILNGQGAYDATRPILIANNTVFASPRHIDNDPYPLSRDQPGHAFVHQNGDGGNFKFVNNLMLLHYNQNISTTSVMNTMSFTNLSLTNAKGIIGYNRYYITPISNSPSAIFNLGAGNNIATWRTVLGNSGDFTDLDGVSNPDSTSEVVNTLPVLVAEFTDTSGKWLETDATPVLTDEGYYIDYASLGITHDLLGNTLGNSLSIGAISNVTSTTYTYNNSWLPIDPNGISASSDDIVIVSGDATINTSTICNSVNVSAGASLTVDTGVELTAVNGLTFESNSTSYSSLIRNGSIIGVLEYKRHVNINGSGITGGNDLISAPLVGQPFNEFASSNSNILRNNDDTLYLFGPFDKVTGSYVMYSNTEDSILNPGIGYRSASTNNDTFTFTGQANSETVIIDIENYGTHEAEWNLIGNPYPSYLNVQAFLNHDVGGVSNLELFDTGTAAIYGYDGSALDGWTIYNLANTNASTVVTPGQGFFVSAHPDKTALYDLEFTPDMRTNGSEDDFIEGRNTELMYLELKASTSNNSYTTDFYFNNNSSLGFDFGYDAEIWGGVAPDFALYSHLVQDNFGRAIALQSLDITNLNDLSIPLGVNTSQGEQLHFSISVSTLPESINVYLEDTVANTITLLNELDYVLTPTTELYGTGRFFLKFTETALSTIQNNLDTITIFTSNSSNELIVSGLLQEHTVLNLYDVQGRNVMSVQLDNTDLENRIDISTFSSGIYIIKLDNTTHQKTQKVVIN